MAWLTFQLGQLPWIAICLALSFALYGLLRKLLAIDAVAGLGVESVYLFAPAQLMLLWFEGRGQLSTVGLIQYIAPTLQFLTGVFVFHEAFDRTRLVGFAFIWAGLVVFAGDGWRRARQRTALAAA